MLRLIDSGRAAVIEYPYLSETGFLYIETEKHMQTWKRNFFTITAGQTVSLIGSSAVQFSIIWWLASETSSPLVMALAGMTAFLPQLLLGPFAGVWIDRLRRKTVVIAADLFMGVVALVFAAFFISGQPPYWSACLVLGVRAVGNVFHTPSIQSIIPMLVPREELVRANSYSQFLQSGAFMLGPVLGAAMYAALPLSVILLTDFFGAVVASVTVAVVRIPEPAHDPAARPHFWREMCEGARTLTADRRLWIVTLASAACMVFFLPVSSYYPLMTSSYFAASAWHASFVELAYAAGMMLFAGVMSRMGKLRDKLLAAQMGMVGIGVTSLVCGIVPPQMWAFWIFAAACCVMGGCGNVFNIPYMAYMQEHVPPEKQGRAFSLIGSLLSLAMPVGLALSGPIAQEFGVSSWFLVTGVAALVISACSIALTRKE